MMLERDDLLTCYLSKEIPDRRMDLVMRDHKSIAECIIALFGNNINLPGIFLLVFILIWIAG